jgi:hypothetical protein
MQLVSIADEVTLEPGTEVRSVQRAEYRLSAAALEKKWSPEGLACLARQFWRPVSEGSGGILRLLRTDHGQRLVMGLAPLTLISFDRPRYALGQDTGEVSWAIKSGLLVAASPLRDRGILRLTIRRRQGDGDPDVAELKLTVEVEGFQPRLRGSGRFARLGTWLYRRTQLKLHVWQARAFMRALAPLPLSS